MIDVGQEDQPDHIQTVEELLRRFQLCETNILKLENYEEASMNYEQISKELLSLEESTRCLALFSPNEPLKEIHTEHLRYRIC